jgi:hypothetical protein
MERRVNDSNQYRELVSVVAQVRRRWRTKLAMRGLAVLGVLLLATFIVATLVLGGLNFAPAAIVTARVVLALVFLGSVAILVLPPLWKRVTDEQVALYLEEREPSLKSSLISALAAGNADSDISPALARRTIETAVARCRKVESGRNLEARSIRRSGGLVAGAVAAGLLLFLLSPNVVRQGARALVMPLTTTAAEAAAAMSISVEPGDTAIARGADLPVTAELFGFGGRGAELYTRVEGQPDYERIPMAPREGEPGYELRLFNLQGAAEYFVESEGVRSPTYRVQVLDLPYVERLQIELTYPEYTGMEPQFYEDGGDIYAPIGTRVRLTAIPTMPVTGGRIAISDAAAVELALDGEGSLSGEFSVRTSGLYHVQLESESSAPRNASPEYLIEVMVDAAPRVVFTRPGRDARVTLTDEVFLEAQATDDFGVRSLELIYSVNGGEEEVLPLYGARPMKEVSVGHTFYLEEFDLQAGDFISYYARVSDVGPEPRRPVTSDMYFVEIRPFGVEYRQADGGGGGGGGGGGDMQQDDDQLSRRQRELISATFNVIRDRDDYTDVEFRQNIEALSTAQEALRRQALTLAERLSNRGSVRDTAFEVIAQSLPRAAREMSDAVRRLDAFDPDDALPSEQRALVHLQRAEAAYREVQVSLQQGGGGGGGGNQMAPTAEDLADLFGLELDQLRNQYETLQRGQQQQAASEVDETLDRVRELARRLERQAEQLRQAMASQTQAGGSAAAQRQLAEETLEEARRLERLSREQSRPELADAAQQLRDAAEAMQRSAANGRSGNTADSQRALERLREATRRLERNQADNLQSATEDAARRARRLSDQQRQISQAMDNLSSAGAGRPQQEDRIVEQKEDQIEELADLERTLDRLAAESRQEQPETSRALRAAAETIRRNQLTDRIRASRANVRPNMPPEYGRRMERDLENWLEEVRDLTEQASRSVSTSGNRGEESLDRARNLVRGLESMQERMRPGDSSQQGQEGQEGQPGQQGQPGQDGQAGQEGQQGGQDGQAGQEGQQGGQAGGEQGGQAGQPGGEQQGGPGGQQAGDGANVGGGGWADGFDSGNRGGYGAWWDDPNQVRQLRSELRERIAEAEELRRQLIREGFDVSELDQALRELRALDSDRVFEDSGRLSLLQAAVVDRMKQFEFSLFQTVRGDEIRRLFLSGTGDVPPEFRELVERYYRELSDGR